MPSCDRETMWSGLKRKRFLQGRFHFWHPWVTNRNGMRLKILELWNAYSATSDICSHTTVLTKLCWHHSTDTNVLTCGDTAVTGSKELSENVWKSVQRETRRIGRSACFGIDDGFMCLVARKHNQGSSASLASGQQHEKVLHWNGALGIQVASRR